MAVPNLAPGYLQQRKGALDQRAENQRQRAYESSQASSNFLRTLGRDVLGAGLGIGADIAGTAFRDSLTRDERAAAQGTFYPEDTDTSAAIRQAAEARAATELRPQASFGEAAETGFGRRGIDTGTPTLGGAKADVLRPAAPSTPAPPQSSNPMLTPGIEAQFGRVLGAPVAPPSIPRRDAMDETPRRPMPAPQSAPTSQPRPMAAQGTREAPGGYQPPRLMPSTTAAMAREAGYRDSIPSLPASVRGLAQQSQDVRDKRSLDLELMRKQLLWDEQQATANVERLRAQGASATAIAQAKQQEADQKGKTEVFRQLYLGTQAQNEGGPKYVKGLGVTATPQTVKLYGDTANGLGAEVVDRGAVGRQGGTGRGGAPGGAQPGEMEGNAMMVVFQNRDKNGVAKGPGQAVLVNIGPPLFRRAASNPTDVGIKLVEDVAALKAAYRAYNEAMPGMRIGAPADASKFTAAENQMVGLIQRAQDTYKTDVANVRGALGYSERAEGKDTLASLQSTAAAAKAAADAEEADRKERLAAAAGAIPVVTEDEITTSEVMKRVLEDPELEAGAGMFPYALGDGALSKEQLAAAVRGAKPPADLEDAVDVQAYLAVQQKAADIRNSMTKKQQAKGRAVVGLGAAKAGLTPTEMAAYVENQGLSVPDYLKTPSATPAPARAERAIPPGALIEAATPAELKRKIQGMEMTVDQKKALYNREAKARGWE